MEHISHYIRRGMREREIAWELEKFLREKGSQSLPFEIVVASALNSALPHAKPTDRPIGGGEPIVIDIGAKIGGYNSDLTRTLFLGNPDPVFERIYHIILEAQRAALEGIREGMSGEEADALSREVIERAGFGSAFGHGLGHGIGLAPHENPRLGLGSSHILSEGMVFTIEPGIYLPDWGGVRVEDVVVLEKGRLKVLSQSEK
jgi:Xaa-Pro aminopeptidase